MKYKVLWFDDEHLELETIKEDALKFNIDLIGYSNAEDGLKELKNNFSTYNGVIVDGLFFDKPGQKGNATENTAFGEVAIFLRSQKDKGNLLPWFIFSGQPSFVKEKNDLVKILADKDFNNGKVYDKNIDEDFDKLCLDIIDAANKIESTKIKIKYAEAFDAIGDAYLNQECAESLLEVIQNFENDTWSKNSFTPLRKIIESIYKSLHNYDDRLIPIGCLRFQNDQVNFKYCELRLIGQDIREQNSPTILYRKIPAVLPDHIGRIINPITKICSGASHANEGIFTKYSLGMVIFSVVDLLIWYKKFVDENYL